MFKSDSGVPAGIPSEPLSSQAKGDSNQVIQTSASAPAPAATTTSSFSWFTGKDKSKSQVSEIAIGWRNWIDYLPDPTKNGVNGPGLAGQMFLFGPGLQTVEADGSLTVDLFDETPRPPGQPGNVPERWNFDRETLKKLRSVDERFGKCYVLFLPWPTYRPDVTKVRLVVRYQADGKTIMPEETKLTLGNNPSDEFSSHSSQFAPGQGQGLQPIGALSLVGSPSTSGMGMGTLAPGGMPNGNPLAGAPPLGVIGSLPSGAPLSSMPASNLPPTSSAMPITGSTMSSVPLSSLQGSGTSAPPQAGNRMPAAPIAPASSGSSAPANGLTPVAGAPQGLPPLAYTANPLGR
jgi:hypothetical protein